MRGIRLVLRHRFPAPRPTSDVAPLRNGASLVSFSLDEGVGAGRGVPDLGTLDVPADGFAVLGQAAGVVGPDRDSREDAGWRVEHGRLEHARDGRWRGLDRLVGFGRAGSWSWAGCRFRRGRRGGRGCRGGRSSGDRRGLRGWGGGGRGGDRCGGCGRRGGGLRRGGGRLRSVGRGGGSGRRGRGVAAAGDKGDGQGREDEEAGHHCVHARRVAVGASNYPVRSADFARPGGGACAGCVGKLRRRPCGNGRGGGSICNSGGV